jgi:hypothetical protein
LIGLEAIVALIADVSGTLSSKQPARACNETM